MELLPLTFYSLSQAVDFINQKTNSTIKENLLYSYAMEEKIRFLLKIEIKDNQLRKIGRMETEGFFLSKDSELYFRNNVIEDEGQNEIWLEDNLSKLDITFSEIMDAGIESYLSYDNANIDEYKGYIVIHPELLDLFCRESIPQHGLKNTNYLLLDEFNVQNPLEADIFNSFNFRMEYAKYNEDEQLYIKHAFRINFSDIKIHYNDLIKLLPTEEVWQEQEKLKQEITTLKTELSEEKERTQKIEKQLKEQNYPILLGVHRKDDLLKIAIEVRNKYWADYPENVKSNAQIRDYIMRDYGVTKTTATEIEKIACPIDRKKN
ncbi:hypothetical protein [Actinobacillus pleuropneumoniae]|uniref:hypothetical protein n=1 Tax=Actinobacillus pleuropneumoniae TaxID=715 RepID=UPI003AAAEB03